MKKIIRCQTHREEAAEECMRAPDGYVVTIKKHSEAKTLQQVRYVFGPLYGCILDHIEGGTGEIFTKDELHPYMKKKIYGPQFKEFDGEIVEVELKMSKKDKAVWMDYIDRLGKYAYSRWGLFLPVCGE